VSEGNLPSGLTLNPKNGDIDGTPGQAGDYPVFIHFTDLACHYQQWGKHENTSGQMRLRGQFTLRFAISQ
jgi:Putative Ig domain